MTQNKFYYSAEMTTLSSLLYNCLPRRLFKDTKNIIVPRNSVLRIITISTYMNPVVDQHDNFFLNIKNSSDLPGQKDVAVSFLADEIHLNLLLIIKLK